MELRKKGVRVTRRRRRFALGERPAIECHASEWESAAFGANEGVIHTPREYLQEIISLTSSGW